MLQLFKECKKVYDAVRMEVLYNILVEFGIPTELARLIKIYLNVRVGKHLFDMFTMKNGLKQGDALQPLLFNFALEYAIRMVAANKDGLKLNGTHQLLVYVDDAKIMGGSVRNTKKNKDLFVVARKENGPGVNAAKV